MKTILMIGISSALLLSSAFGFKVPKKAWTMDQLDEARSTAVEKSRGLMFIMADPQKAPS